MASVNGDRLAHLLSRTKETGTGCMEFVGCIQSNGYARATVYRKTDYAHRHVFSMLNGAIPSGMDVCHTCDNRKCINPAHLFLGSRLDNMLDAKSKGRLSCGDRHSLAVPKGEDCPGAKLSTEKVRFIRYLSGGPATNRAIAARLEVSPSLIGLVINLKIWRHI